jgi:hypothetical protein
VEQAAKKPLKVISPRYPLARAIERKKTKLM